LSFLSDKKAKKKIPVIAIENSKLRYAPGNTGITKTVIIVKNSKSPFATADLFFLPSVENQFSKLVKKDFFMLFETG